ncbi:probable serine/threonine-protein kinase DDB_G0282963 [Camponotus floridanus]|uniref:probable serine/threonine-protein kinase DDB_G0282963 n=1 Tax=Camponotus floridanus TaxID=104421 RepID=UPI000DC6A6C9|nr:probable serine/threonine-protein kinase DDB_G0282963 [Camponotus floridanus]
MKCILHNALKTIHLISPLQTKHFLLMKKLASEILPSSVNSMHLEYIGSTTKLKSTESYNSKKIDVDTLQTVQYTIAAMKNQVQSPVADAIYSNDLETNLINEFPEKIIPSPVGFIKTDAHSSFSPTENEQALRNNRDRNPSAPKQEIYIDKNKKYSPHVQLINEATNFEKVRIYPQNCQSASKERLTSMTNIDSTRDLDINNRKVTEELLEFDKNAVETNARYEKQSMVSMSKDVPTTPAVNSFEQKTPSETFLSLDRISTQPINKNTPTNKSEAPRNDSDINVFTSVKRRPSFSENAQKNKQFAIRRKRNSQLLRDSRNKLQGETMSGNHRVFPLIENNTAEITPMLRRDDPLQASTRNKRMTAPIVSQKDILNKNTEEAEYKNNTTQKKNTKPSLQNNQSEVAIKEGRKGSTNENATMKDSVNATLPYMQKFRFPLKKLLPTRSKLHKKEHNSISTKYANPNRFSSSHFQHFYEAKENLLSKINNITVEKTKSTHFEFLSEASRAYLSKRKNEKILKKFEARDYALDMKTSNVSALNDSISTNKNDLYEYSTSNSQNASLASNKTASHLNVSSQEIEKSMQTKAVYNNYTESSTPENSSKVSSKEIVQKITDNLKQLSDINRDNAPKYFSTK